MTKSYPKPSQPFSLCSLSKTAAEPAGVALWWMTIHFHGRAGAFGTHVRGTPACASGCCGSGCGTGGGATGAGAGGGTTATGGGAITLGPLKFGEGNAATAGLDLPEARLPRLSLTWPRDRALASASRCCCDLHPVAP